MKKTLYTITICLLAVVSVVFAIIDFLHGLNQVQTILDQIIYLVFLVDYFTRLVIAKEKKKFIKENVFDLIAIIPFNSAFRAFRTLKILRFAKFLKLIKLFRVAAFSARALKKTKRFFDTNGLKYVLLLVAISILLSSIAMMYFEHMTFQNSLWWSFVTATTVGYGDISPATGIGRIIAALLMLVGIGLIGSLTSSITTFFLHPPVSDQETNTEKVDMVLTLYEKLSIEERELFRSNIED